MPLAVAIRAVRVDEVVDEAARLVRVDEVVEVAVAGARGEGRVGAVAVLVRHAVGSGDRLRVDVVLGRRLHVAAVAVAVGLVGVLDEDARLPARVAAIGLAVTAEVEAGLVAQLEVVAVVGLADRLGGDGAPAVGLQASRLVVGFVLGRVDDLAACADDDLIDEPAGPVEGAVGEVAEADPGVALTPASSLMS